MWGVTPVTLYEAPSVKFTKNYYTKQRTATITEPVLAIRYFLSVVVHTRNSIRVIYCLKYLYPILLKLSGLCRTNIALQLTAN
jgi:hypothetical protein